MNNRKKKKKYIAKKTRRRWRKVGAERRAGDDDDGRRRRRAWIEQIAGGLREFSTIDTLFTLNSTVNNGKMVRFWKMNAAN